MKTAQVHTTKACQFHADRDAIYDAKTQMGPWAYVCQECFNLMCYPNTKELAFKLESKRPRGQKN